MASTARWAPERAEIIFVQHSPALGNEIDNLHSLLVCSPRAFNEKTGLVIGFPMTHAEFHKDNPFALPLKGPKGTAYVLCHQPKSFDWRARGAKPHPWKGTYHEMLSQALVRLDAICGISAAVAGSD
jgi:mRNA interferase MazF